MYLPIILLWLAKQFVYPRPQIFWKKAFREKRKTITDNTPEIIRLQHILLTHICWVNKCFVQTSFIYFPLLQAAAGLLSSRLFQDYMWGKRIICSSQSSSRFRSGLSRAGTLLVPSHSPREMHYFTDAWMQTGHSWEHPQCSREQQAAAHNSQENPKFSHLSPLGAVSGVTLRHYRTSCRSQTLPCEIPRQEG